LFGPSHTAELRYNQHNEEQSINLIYIHLNLVLNYNEYTDSDVAYRLVVCYSDYITGRAKSTTPTLTHVIPSQGKGRVTAVASVGDEVFVARFNSQHVEVYDAVTLALQRRLAVPELGEQVYGVAVCSDNKCLYASDYGHDSIHRMELTAIGEAKKWSVASRPAGLSVNKGHNLIVACYGANRLQEYTTHGSLVKDIYLPAGMTSPWHSVQLSTGDYVVSQNTSQGAVSVVGVYGQIVHNYGQSDIGRTKCPKSLAVTDDDDILVADELNNRILSIDRSFYSIQELALFVDGGMHSPRGLCLDESRGRLYVGEWSTECRVMVFDDVHL